jgi:hypothetical protein
MAIEAKYSKDVLSFHDGYAAVQTTNGPVVFIDKQGNTVSPEYYDARRFCHGYAIVETIQEGYQGETQVINTKFEVIRKYSDDDAPVIFPSRFGPSDPFEDPFVLLDFGNYIWAKDMLSVSCIYTADGQPFICNNKYAVDAFYGKLAHVYIDTFFYGKLAHAGNNGIIDLEKSIQTGYVHFIILFPKPEF